MNAIAEALISAGSGGLFGGLLALGNTWLTAKIRRDERAHELEVAKLTAQMRVTSEEWSAFRASHEAAAGENSTALWPAAASIRALTRPALTLLLVACSVWVYGTAPGAVRGDIGRDLLMLTGTAIGWWFGSRPTLASSRR